MTAAVCIFSTKYFRVNSVCKYINVVELFLPRT